MKIFDTRELPADGAGLSPNDVYWIYNGLDSCMTSEIREVLSSQMDEVSRATYDRTMQMQAPILEMMLRGTLIDKDHRARTLAECNKTRSELVARFDRLCMEGLGLVAPINPQSPAQVKHLLYDVLKVPVIKARNSRGFMAPSSSRETLEHLSEYFIAEPFCKYILAIRDQSKQIGFLKTPLDSDDRIRCNFNLAGTNTGRLSSSFSDFGSGTNLQNIDRNLRYIFVADPGKVLVNIDLEQADSRNVGALCWDMFYESHGPEFAGSYLDACESSDLHTLVCSMGWPNLSWGSDETKWRALADTTAYRTYSYRDMAKKLGHGTNYYGQPNTMAKHSKVPVKQIADFQGNYFSAFPCIPAWHEETIRRLQENGSLTHLFGRRRYFFGRLDDQSVINAAIAYSPQGMTGEEINLGLLNLWRDPRFELMIQVHDSILFQVDEKLVNELVPIALELLRVPIMLKGGREFYVPLDAEVGWNWGKRSKDGKTNPYGMTGWKGEELRQPPRKRAGKRLSILDVL